MIPSIRHQRYFIHDDSERGRVSKRERERMRELALPAKYNTTQAVLHLERCQTRPPHQAMTSYIRTSQFTPHLIGLGNATYIYPNTKKIWPKTLFNMTNSK